MPKSRFAAGLCALLVAPASWASVDWEWSFTQSTVNLAQSPSVYVTVTNLATSDESIADAHLVLSSFGTFGVLVDPANGNVLTPVINGPMGALAPGQSVTFEAMRFYFSGPTAPGLPSSTFSATIAPLMEMYPASCPSFGCGQSEAGAAALTLTYAPVPEPASWGLWLAGVAALGAAARRRR